VGSKRHQSWYRFSVEPPSGSYTSQGPIVHPCHTHIVCRGVRRRRQRASIDSLYGGGTRRTSANEKITSSMMAELDELLQPSSLEMLFAPHAEEPRLKVDRASSSRASPGFRRDIPKRYVILADGSHSKYLKWRSVGNREPRMIIRVAVSFFFFSLFLWDLRRPPRRLPLPSKHLRQVGGARAGMRFRSREYHDTFRKMEFGTTCTNHRPIDRP